MPRDTVEMPPSLPVLPDGRVRFGFITVPVEKAAELLEKRLQRLKDRWEDTAQRAHASVVANARVQRLNDALTADTVRRVERAGRMRAIALTINPDADALARRRGLSRIVTVATPIGPVKMRAWQARQYRFLRLTLGPVAALERTRTAGVPKPPGEPAPWIGAPTRFETSSGPVFDDFGIITRNRWMRERYGDRTCHGRVAMSPEQPAPKPVAPPVQTPAVPAQKVIIEMPETPPIIGMVQIRDIVQALASYVGQPVPIVIGERRSHDLARPRQMAMWLACRYTPLSLPAIGRIFGGRDHTTVMHARDVVEERLQDPKVQDHEIYVMRMMAALAGIDITARLVPDTGVGAGSPMACLVTALAAYVKAPPSAVQSPRQGNDFGQARQAAMFIAHRDLKASLSDIGRAFWRNHTTVSLAVEAVRARLMDAATAASEVARIDEIRRLAGMSVPEDADGA